MSNSGNNKISHQTLPLEMRPQLNGQISIYQDHLILSQKGRDYAFQVHGQSKEKLQKILSKMDGTYNLRELQENFSPQNPELIYELILNLDKQGFIDDVSSLNIHSGIDASQELEKLADKLFDKSLKDNSLWQAFNSTTPDLPRNVIYGFVIEHYHLFTHNSDFHSPLFNFQGSAKIRQVVKERYSQEYGQDELLLTALNTIAISHEQLLETLPLPETMAISNALTYWANFDPLFYLSILEILATHKLKIFELYIQSCEQMQIDDLFIQPLQQLINYKLNSAPESFTSHIYQELAPIDEATKQRLKSQIYLFVEIYNNFYQAICNYYTNTNNLLRKLATI
ncbi:MAG TPA: hypothetical protein VK203_30715 [Nostocaceae cyanobacterium]|nr:hypothetical protein [Nostocaceae cyanobacterium]